MTVKQTLKMIDDVTATKQALLVIRDLCYGQDLKVYANNITDAIRFLDAYKNVLEKAVDNAEVKI